MNVSTISSLVNSFRVYNPNTPDFARYNFEVDTPGSYFGSFPELVNAIMNIVLTVGIIAVLFYLIWGGLEYITSGGDKSKTESARNKITSAIIGLIILISAWAIIMFVQQLLDISILSSK